MTISPDDGLRESSNPTGPLLTSDNYYRQKGGFLERSRAAFLRISGVAERDFSKRWEDGGIGELMVNGELIMVNGEWSSYLSLC